MFLKSEGKTTDVETEGRALSMCTGEGREYIYCFWKFRNCGQNSTLLKGKEKIEAEFLEKTLQQNYHKRATESCLFFECNLL